MAPSLIAQHAGTLQSKIKKCKGIINMSNFSRMYVVNILTTKQIINSKIASQGNLKKLKLKLIEKTFLSETMQPH
jgi:hypothetical protein